MYDIYIIIPGQGTDTFMSAGKGLSRGEAKKAIDQLMAAQKRPKVVAYRAGRYAYNRNF